MYRILIALTVACGFLLTVGCSDSSAPTEPATTTSQPAPSAPSPTSGGSELASNQGVVVSQMSVGGYTYVEVENSGQRIWIASNPIEVTEGEVIGWGQAAMMTNFYSKSLDRTFEQILFVGQVFGPAVKAGVKVPSNTGKVLSVQNAAGYSYLEVEADTGAMLWVAVPETPIKANDHISWQDGSVMRNFTSNSLGQTFEEIVFSAGAKVQN